MTKFLETQGQYNPDDNPDGEGTTLFDYLKRFNFHSGGMAHTHGSSFKLKGKGPSRSQQRIKTKSSNTGSTNRERYIASTKGGTSTPPPKTIVKSSDGGGNTGGNDDSKITRDITYPVPTDTTEDLDRKKDIIQRDKEVKAGVFYQDTLFGGEIEAGAEIYHPLESFKIEPEFRASAEWTGDNTRIEGSFENDSFEAEIKKDLGNDWIGTAGYGSDDNTFALGLRKEWKSGGLLDRKRLK